MTIVEDHVMDQIVSPSGTDRQQQLDRWNTTHSLARELCIHQRFEQQVGMSPDAVALEYEGQPLSYRELNARANQLAHRLRDLGLGPDERVAICLHRGPVAVISLLAVLKAGGGFVPLDPRDPRQRLRDMLEDVAPRALLTESNLRGALDVPAGFAVLELDHDAGWQGQRAENLDCTLTGVRPEHLAYIIYTSGSTGRPKGVVIEHRALNSQICALQNHYRIAASDRLLQFVAPTFDVSLEEIFGALLSGATLVLRTDAWITSPHDFCALSEQHAITVANLPTLFWQQVADAQETRFAPCLRLIIIGGDSVSAGALERWWKRPGHRPELCNAYGPTEATINATVVDCTPDTPARSIGRPLPNVALYVLDRPGSLAPAGVEGEIYIGGVQVARGYWNRPDLTRERFVRDPFAAAPGARMYRTGDLGRWRTDGTLEFLGRNDHQVKIRGFRIELGEIEAALESIAGVQQALVMAREDEPGDKRLVGYVVAEPTPAAQAALNAESLRQHVRRLLPESMVPSALVTLERLPLLPNGKVDRLALPAPGLEAYMSRPYEAPQGDVEAQLCTIWQDLLRVPQIGRHDNFFELGGHSLLIAGMVERLRSIGWSTEIHAIFKSASLCELAQALTRSAGSSPAARAPWPIVDSAQFESIARAVPGGGANIQELYPLSPLQEGLLFHHLLDPAGPDPYVGGMLFALASRDELERFQKALQTVIGRHDALRTAVLWEGLPSAVQVVCRDVSLEAMPIELDPARESIAQLQERLVSGRARLDLGRAPLLRIEIAADPGGQRWYALLFTHHLVCDNLSLELLTAELTACMNGAAQALPPPVPYREHVALALAADHARDAESFFRARLHDIEEPTAPFGLVDAHAQGVGTMTVSRTLEGELAERLRAAARGARVSPATLFHAAWALVVSRTSGRADVVFGTVLLGRMQGGADAQRIVGLLINTLPLRVCLEAETARGLVEQTQRELCELLSYEHASLALARRCSGVAGSAPLFTALLNYRGDVSGAAAAPEGFGEAGLRVLARHGGTNYPVALSVDDRSDRFVLEMETDRRIDAGRMLEYVCTALHSLVEALCSAPTRPALALPVLPESERHQLLEQFNPSQPLRAADRLVHEQFELQAARRPDAVAVICEAESLTYAELNARANQLARHLRAQGVGPDERVAICTPRSLAMVVAQLGVLKAGGAYVPLDPSSPDERLHYLLQDAAPRVVLTQKQLLPRVAHAGCPVVALDGDWSAIARQSPRDLQPDEVGVQPGHLAYVIYTSGSTGKPKGVMVEHGNLNRLFTATERQFQFDEQDVWTVFHSFAFDFSVWELWGALRYGGRAVLVPQATARSPEEFYRLVCEAGVTVLNRTPSAFCQLIEAQAQSDLRHALRLVIFGGEALELRTLRPWVLQNGAERPQLVNMYGITETTVHVTYQRLSQTDIAGESARSPIGSAIDDLRVYVLDAQREPVPVGVVGELYVGGAGVARGYLNRPELTAERYLPDPFRAQAHARMYKSGDLGRWRADGTLEYLGRNDSQVKIRGYRIELGEIEAALASMPGVKQALVLAREDSPGDKRLVGYVIAKGSPVGETALTAESLRAHLLPRLPEYMVPSAFVLLPSLPLTVNGKLDRRALPAPGLEAHVIAQYQPPRGEVEELLAGIWQALLGVPRVGRDDNFFELGGHSLLIVQMLGRLRAVGLVTELRRVFDSASLATLARALTPVQRAQTELPPNMIPPDCTAITPEMLTLVQLCAADIERVVESVPGGAANVQDIYPLTPLQEGILFHHLFHDRGRDAYLVQTLLSVDSRERMQQLLSALQAVIDRHDALRTAVLWEQLPRPVQVVHRRAPLHVRKHTLNASDDARAFLQQRMRAARLDLQKAPLLRVEVAQGPHDGACHVLLQHHHIVDDASSLQVVISEVVAQLEGTAAALLQPEPYRNHVAEALEYQRSEDAESFFRDKLADVDEPTAPFGMLDVHADGRNVEEVQEELAAELVQAVRSRARSLCVSAATLVHAAWALVVARTSGRDDVVFGTVLLGRLRASTGTQTAQPTVGMFINTLPLRLRLSSVSAEELVKQTQRELAELMTHELASLAVARNCSALPATTPLFSALLNYRHGLAAQAWDWAAADGIQVLEEQERTNYPVVVSVNDLGDKISLCAQTDQQVAARRFIAYLRTALHSLVEALCSAPTRPALSLPVLPENELRQVLQDFNPRVPVRAADRLVHEEFELQAGRRPDAIAVVCEAESLTYGELNARANQLARYLGELGVGPDERVAICTERSLAMVVAQLGVLKAGGAYVPIDPTSPDERLHYMLQDAAPKVVLTQKHLRSRVANAGCTVVALDSDWSAIARKAQSDLQPGEVAVQAGHLAYVIYTSGSTGKPKGVMVEHGNLNRLFTATERQFEFGEQDVWTVFHSFAFDVSVFELWGALRYGGRAVLVPQATARSPQEFYRLVCEAGVTVLSQTPSAFYRLIEAQAKSDLPHALRLVIFAGEALDLRTLRPWVLQNGAERPQLVNMYGITETTVHVTYQLMSETDIASESPNSPIGSAIDDLRVYVLSGQREPVPVGVVGELYVGGAGVARGYLNRPELTAERYLRDPFSSDQHARMYKSGDLGRWRADGTLEYLGRNDSQVKIRGYRIELGEIEAALASMPGVKQALVLAREEGPGDKRLVGYMVAKGSPTGETALTAESLRAHLQSRLPDYMVPSAFVVLPSFPLTVNGKLDRRALPSPGLEAHASRPYQPPRSEVEEILAGIWQALLGVPRVGRDDNFFELGGHSLLALALIVRIDQALGRSLSVSDVYRSPTLEALATRTSEGVAQDERVDLSQNAQLDPQIVASAGVRRVAAQVVLLTGCTGFVGRFLLAQLLADTDATIYCLVRAPSAEQAMLRLETMLLEWDLWSSDVLHRVRAVPGDLSRPRLGLRADVYEALAATVDCIYHCAASMNHLETYAMAKPANVDATRDLLQFAVRGRPKLVNYISTLGVFGDDGAGTSRVVTEDTAIDRERHLASAGYSASKWVSEKLLMLAGERGVACNIFRLGLVWADSQEGRYDPLQREYRLFKSCLLSGLAIHDYRYDAAPLPVDHVARAIVCLGSRHENGGGIFHLASQDQPATLVFEQCNAIADTSLELVSHYQWTCAMRDRHRSGWSLPIVPLIESAFSMSKAEFVAEQRRQESARLRADCTKTLSELESAGVIIPRWNEELLSRCITDMCSRDNELRPWSRATRCAEPRRKHG